MTERGQIIMFFDYELNTVEDIRQAIIELEAYLDLGHSEVVYIKRDLNTLYELLEEHKYLDDKEPIKNNRLNRHKRKGIGKKKLKKLNDVCNRVIIDKGTHQKRCYVSNRRKAVKRWANKAVRQYNGTIPDGGAYRKLYPYWYSIY